ncbi:SRPBCC domain-containing protein [Enteractinococcus coprophilus]|uniref:Uncharacterized protein YndB with AHSA1/START domain n=2 Tax=Micrococcales TaxID=85006 RepID=A0A543AFW9_9MICC|nr:SRPBCC domain-containing protein [Enteractinococcus coprophilus]TQL71483.1 uncharacterized protein YndB with AHSA1/START domain [Enteractinococcus coprophilus]
MTHTNLVHDTITVTQLVNAPVADVWQAYADTAVRAQWSVPSGDGLEYDSDEFVTGGNATYRCGTPDVLEFAVVVDYVLVESPRLIVYTETLGTQDAPLATSLVTWEFDESPKGTSIVVTNQTTSFVGEDMMTGMLNGHRIALQQLAERFEP